MNKVEVFNVITQKDELHEVEFDTKGSSDIILKGSEGHVLKVPPSVYDSGKMKEYLAKYKADNIGQVKAIPIEAQDDKLKELLKGL